MLDKLQRLLSSNEIPDFRVESFDSVNLLVIGSFDLAYYHQVELLFGEVSYLACPMAFSDPTFRMASPEEVATVPVPLGENDKVFAIQCDSCGIAETSALVVAETLSVVEGRAYHYERENLAPGERIAEWARR